MLISNSWQNSVIQSLSLLANLPQCVLSSDLILASLPVGEVGTHLKDKPSSLRCSGEGPPNSLFPWVYNLSSPRCPTELVFTTLWHFIFNLSSLVDRSPGIVEHVKLARSDFLETDFSNVFLPASENIFNSLSVAVFIVTTDNSRRSWHLWNVYFKGNARQNSPCALFI